MTLHSNIPRLTWGEAVLRHLCNEVTTGSVIGTWFKDATDKRRHILATEIATTGLDWLLHQLAERGLLLIASRAPEGGYHALLRAADGREMGFYAHGFNMGDVILECVHKALSVIPRDPVTTWTLPEAPNESKKLESAP